MGKFRVLVVDDAIVFRRLISEEISRDPLLEVVDTASNGRIALTKLTHVNPDAVVLDVEMPELDGLKTLAEIRKIYPRLPVIMFSALTERGANATLDALALGASDYFAKPVSAEGVDASLHVVRTQLIPKIKALCAHERHLAEKQEQGASTARIGPLTSAGANGKPARPVERIDRDGILAIGCSTGGPNALTEFFGRLGSDFPLPIVIVQHMPPMFTQLLAERMSAQFHMRFHEGVQGATLEPGSVWIAPGDHHMIVARNGLNLQIRTNQDPPENSCRPAVDVLLRSVARTYGANSITVILTGMGQDGLHGCEDVRDAGGQILAQDELSSVVWGMPGSVVRAGFADKVLPPAQLAEEVLRRVAHIAVVR